VYRYAVGRVLLIVTLLTASAGCTVVWSDSGDAPAGQAARPTASAPAVDVRGALRDVERFWSATYPQLADGAAFKPVSGGYHPYMRTDLPPACGPEQPEYQPNAFYCPAGDFIAWDAETLIPQLNADFGPLLVGVVMAHEYGHAIQTRLNTSEQPTVVLEQQADCFAGAWTADVLAGRSTAFPKPTPEQLDKTAAGLVLLRDEPGTSARNPQAHGNAFDRIRAYQEGIEQGAQQCAGYRSGNLPVTEVPFQTPEDAANGGDLPYSDAVNGLAADAETYWERTYPRLANAAWADLPVRPFAGEAPDCPAPDATAGGAAFYCPDGDFVAFDNQRLGPLLYQRIGDNAVGMLLGELFARAAQDRRGVSTRDKAGQLAVDCLTGSWANSMLLRRRGDGVTLSPGDLDEAVIALLAFGGTAQQTGVTAFERIAAYRNGVLKGLGACA
jgi:predicted metalloprotease